MGEPSVGAPLSAGPTEDRLDSWKEIAVYLNRDATTVQRWEKREGMPVHRHLHDKIGSVYASKAELDAWARSRNLQAAQKNGNDVAIEEPVASAPATETTPSFWNRRRVVGVALVAFLMIGGFAAWRLLFARPVLTTTDVILQTSFINRTGDPIFDNSLDDALAVKLTESPFLSLLPEADVRRTMGTMRHNPNERVTRELGIEICRRQGLKAVVVPAIDAFGGRYLITLEAIDASSGKTLARRQVEAESKDKVIAALGKAASELRTRLGESLSSLEKYNAPLNLATTSSLEALQAYSTGQTLARSGKRRDAIALFERAIDLDPRFCSAYLALGAAYRSVGDEEAAKKNYVKAFELKDSHLTQEENFEATALYHSAVTGNLEKEDAVVTLYKLAYPRSVSAFNLSGIVHALLGRTEEALQEFNWCIDHSPVPSSNAYSNASNALLILGRIDEAQKMLEQWRQKGTFTPIQTALRYRIAFLTNDGVTMDRITRETPPDEVRLLREREEFAFYRGHFGELRSLNETLVKQDLHSNEKENASFDLAWHARVESLAGNYVLARKLCLQAEEMSNDDFLALENCAAALAYAGDVTQAEALAAKLDRQFPENTLNQKIYLPLIRSIIERQRGNMAKAVDLLSPVMQFPNAPVFYNRALAYAAAGEHPKAIDEFGTVIARRGWPDWAIYAPLAQLGLARTYPTQGSLENSRKAYNDLFTTWKDADPDIPILKQAQAEYSKLK
jgi:tetratricopeptide (TPR) repeat protein